MLSKRAYSRLYSEGTAILLNISSPNSFDSYYTNISANGINISTQTKLSDNQMVDLQIHLPLSVSVDSKVIYRKGIVIRKDISGKYLSYGIKFVNQSNLDIIELDEYVNKNILQNTSFLPL